MSGQTEHDLELVLSSVDGALVPVTEAVDRLATDYDLPPKTRFNLELIIEELVLNSMTHGRQGDEEHEIIVRIRVGDARIAVQIEDDGRPYDPVAEAPSAPVDQSAAERPVGGLGVHIVKRMAESFEYRYFGGKNRVTLEMKREPDA